MKVGVESMKRKYREGENTREQGMKLRNLGEAKKEGEKGGRTQFLLFVFLCHLISCSVLVIFS